MAEVPDVVGDVQEVGVGDEIVKSSEPGGKMQNDRTLVILT